MKKEIQLTRNGSITQEPMFSPTIIFQQDGRKPFLTMHCDGRITYTGAPDDATQMFLNALGKAFPDFVKGLQRAALELGAQTIDNQATRHSSRAFADCSLILRTLSKSL